jgi:hypothetical protein
MHVKDQYEDALKELPEKRHSDRRSKHPVTASLPRWSTSWTLYAEAWKRSGVAENGENQRRERGIIALRKKQDVPAHGQRKQDRRPPFAGNLWSAILIIIKENLSAIEPTKASKSNKQGWLTFICPLSPVSAGLFFCT